MTVLILYGVNGFTVVGDGQRDMDTILKTIKDVKKNLDDKLNEARKTVKKIG